MSEDHIVLILNNSILFQIILGKVVCTVIPDSGIPFSMCLVDKDGSCIAVTVYNWASGCGVKIGDSVAIVAPVLKTHKIDVPGDEVSSFMCPQLALVQLRYLCLFHQVDVSFL